jgi:hypothetical protein
LPGFGAIMPDDARHECLARSLFRPLVKISMNRLLSFKTASLIAGLLALPLAHSGAMTKAEYRADKSRIEADYKADMVACGKRAGSTLDVCGEEAKARQKVARAGLEYAHTSKAGDGNKLLVAKAESAYAVAKAKCGDKSGNVKDMCITQAKAMETKALADARLGMQVGEAREDAATEKRDADFKVAAEKCDAMSGTSKDSCVAAAKLKFGKS